MVTGSTEGYRPNLQQVLSDLQVLCSIFLASSVFAERCRQEPVSTLERLPIAALEEDTITRLLLSTAITLRVLDDREDGALDMLSLNCGTLTTTVGSQDPIATALTIRDACNKIIHAKKFTLERHDSNRPGYAPLHPYIHMRGTDPHRRRSWQASISIFEFVREGMLGVHMLMPKSAA